MIFVNNIGEIVHSMVDRFMGAANKVRQGKNPSYWNFKYSLWSFIRYID